eukprot:SAG31_NODE_942_length_10853_cov_24.620420_1_plen_1141_part_10
MAPTSAGQTMDQYRLFVAPTYEVSNSTGRVTPTAVATEIFKNGVSLGFFEPGQIWRNVVNDFDEFVATAPIYGNVRVSTLEGSAAVHAMVPEAFRGTDFAVGNTHRGTVGIWIRALGQAVDDCSVTSGVETQSIGVIAAESSTYVEISATSSQEAVSPYPQSMFNACGAYTQFKFNLDPASDNTGLRNWGVANSVQLAEMDFYSVSGTMLEVASVENPGGNNPGNGRPANVINGAHALHECLEEGNDCSNLKWLDFNRGDIVVTFAEPTVVGSYNWMTANNAPARDPTKWTLEASNDGSDWAVVDEANANDAFDPPQDRYTWTGPWNVCQSGHTDSLVVTCAADVVVGVHHRDTFPRRGYMSIPPVSTSAIGVPSAVLVLSAPEAVTVIEVCSDGSEASIDVVGGPTGGVYRPGYASHPDGKACMYTSGGMPFHAHALGEGPGGALLSFLDERLLSTTFATPSPYEILVFASFDPGSCDVSGTTVSVETCDGGVCKGQVAASISAGITITCDVPVWVALGTRPELDVGRTAYDAVVAFGDLNSIFGMEAHYSFDDESAIDSSGNGRDGVWEGIETYAEGANGEGRAASFDGSSRIIVDAFSGFAWGRQLTVSLWFKRTGAAGNYMGIANIGQYIDGAWEIHRGREGGGTMLGGGVVTVGHAHALTTAFNDWHHVLMVDNGAQLHFWLDGTPDDHSANDSGDLVAVDNPLFIGQAGTGSASDYFVGEIDEVKILSQAVHAGQLNALSGFDFPPPPCGSGLTIANSPTTCSGVTGDTCTFSCNDGYTASGSHVCRSDGAFAGGSCVHVQAWNRHLQSDDGNSCSSGLTIANSSTTCSGMVGDTCTFSCNDGYTAFGSHVCGSDGAFVGGSCVGNGFHFATRSQLRSAIQECQSESATFVCPTSQETYGPIGTWDVSAITDMTNLFHSASAFNGDLSSWDVSSVTSMQFMFYGASSFNGDLSSWDVSSVTTMDNLFDGASSFNGDLSSWDVSSVTSMQVMFRLASSFNGDLSSWDVSSVTTMDNLFDGASSFNGDLSSWDVSSVTSMQVMFHDASSFNGDLSSWDVSSVTSMHHLFDGASSFNGDLSSWDVSSVTSMHHMFDSASSFNGDLLSWDVSSVTSMQFMFYGASSFNGDLSSWDVSSV